MSHNLHNEHWHMACGLYLLSWLSRKRTRNQNFVFCHNHMQGIWLLCCEVKCFVLFIESCILLCFFFIKAKETYIWMQTINCVHDIYYHYLKSLFSKMPRFHKVDVRMGCVRDDGRLGYCGVDQELSMPALSPLPHCHLSRGLWCTDWWMKGSLTPWCDTTNWLFSDSDNPTMWKASSILLSAELLKGGGSPNISTIIQTGENGYRRQCFPWSLQLKLF